MLSPAKLSPAVTESHPATTDVLKDTYLLDFLYALSRSPALVAEYQTRLPDKALLQAKLHEFYELACGRSRPRRSRKARAESARTRPTKKRTP